tara:strand:- start:270 stop:599 length:330 start_codon:yes stop_codon:yes gene_type:complete
MNQKDIVLLPYPFSDLTGTKVRPALVISNNTLNRKSEDCILVPLTTIIKDEPYSVNISQGDISSGKLIRPSRIRVDKIFSVQKSLIIKKICSLKEETFVKVKVEIMGML